MSIQKHSSDPALERFQHIIEAQSFLTAARFNLDAFMEDAAQCAQSLTKASGASVEMSDGPEMVYRACSGVLESFVGFRMVRAGSFSGACVKERIEQVSDNTQYDPRCNAVACKKANVLSMAAAPLIRSGEVVGVLKVVSPHAGGFSAQNVQTLRMMAGLLSQVLEQRVEIRQRDVTERNLRVHSQYDALTSLPNCGLYNDHLFHAVHRAARTGSLVGVLSMDIDFLKSINETYGNTTGDALLRAFAGRIKNVIHANDMFARLGGDEFGLIVENVACADTAIAVARDIINAMRNEFSLQGHNLHVGVSIGLCLHAGAGVTPEYMSRCADLALYEAKRKGRNLFHVYKE